MALSNTEADLQAAGPPPERRPRHALAFPSILSIPYTIDTTLTRLAAALR
ncbi:hypothetical protein [Nocardia puris]|uniref:Uncharacterized protein n=1 Tax=Nocardia puris TaxID=208602 RepID=A0A366DSN4_9NOCA|nr:hypothetical protein [Nocardia puris]RBO92915.1 hypothetical protein DFR74_103563 [Nocardia puris]